MPEPICPVCGAPMEWGSYYVGDGQKLYWLACENGSGCGLTASVRSSEAEALATLSRLEFRSEGAPTRADLEKRIAELEAEIDRLIQCYMDSNGEGERCAIDQEARDD